MFEIRTFDELGALTALDRVVRRAGSRTCSGTARGTAGCSRTVLGEKGDSGEFNEMSRARLPFVTDVARVARLPSPSDRAVSISPRARFVAGLPSLFAVLVVVARAFAVSIMSAVKTRGRKPGELYSPKDESATDPLLILR